LSHQEIADELFEILADKGGEAAIDYFFGESPYTERMDDQLNMLFTQYSSAERMMGDYLGYELLVETNLADRLVYQYYIVLYDRQPIYFGLTFYKPADKWVPQNFAFGDTIDDEVESMTRLFLLQSDKVQVWPKRQEAVPSVYAVTP
jgi:hypothetical protein